MPTSTNVTNLKINELKEAQYDTAVQQGVIGENELSILTDVDAGQVIQVSTLPTASADELDNIYQFVGTTDANYTNGYFYKCVSDGATPAVYSWSRIDVQPSSSLPSQSGQSGKFLTTDGTDASWSSGLKISSSQTIVGNSASIWSGANNTVVGYNAQITDGNGGSTAIGANAISRGYGIAIGNGADLTGSDNSIVIGNSAKVIVSGAIQLGYGTNSVANTFKVRSYEMMSADGTIPHARLTNAVQSTTVTIATTDWSSNTASVTVSGLTATSVVWVAPDNASQSAYTTAGVYASSQSADTLIFTCTQTPTASLTINVVFC